MSNFVTSKTDNGGKLGTRVTHIRHVTTTLKGPMAELVAFKTLIRSDMVTGIHSVLPTMITTTGSVWLRRINRQRKRVQIIERFERPLIHQRPLYWRSRSSISGTANEKR